MDPFSSGSPVQAWQTEFISSAYTVPKKAAHKNLSYVIKNSRRTFLT